MESAFGLHLYSSCDGRTVCAPQMMMAEPRVMAEYLLDCLECGYEAVVSCPVRMFDVAPALADSLVYTNEKLLRYYGREGYAAYLTRSLDPQHVPHAPRSAARKRADLPEVESRCRQVC